MPQSPGRDSGVFLGVTIYLPDSSVVYLSEIMARESFLTSLQGVYIYRIDTCVFFLLRIEEVRMLGHYGTCVFFFEWVVWVSLSNRLSVNKHPICLHAVRYSTKKLKGRTN
jgi:hypothetical protein